MVGPTIYVREILPPNNIMSCVLWELHQQCLVVLPPSNIMSCVQINYNRTQSSMRRLDASLLLVCVHFHQRCRTSPSCLKILSRKFVVWGRPTPRMRQVVRGRLTPYKCQASNLIGLFVDLTLTCVLLLLGLTPTFITAVQLLAHLPPPSRPIPNNLLFGAREPIDVSVESEAQISGLMTPPNSFTPSIPLILSLTSQSSTIPSLAPIYSISHFVPKSGKSLVPNPPSAVHSTPQPLSLREKTTQFPSYCPKKT